MPKVIPNLTDEIIKQAKTILLEKGYENFHLRDVSVACGIALGTIYNYFPNKDELIMAVVGSNWDEINLNVESICAAQGLFYNKLEKIFQEMEQFVTTFHDILFKVKKIDRKNKQGCIDDIFLRLIELIRQFLVLEIKGGNIVIVNDISPEIVARFIVSNFAITAHKKILGFNDLMLIFRAIIIEVKKGQKSIL